MVRSACSGLVVGRWSSATTRYHSYRAVKNILANGLDKIEAEQLSANQPSLPLHANIRGNDYYHSKEER